MCTTHIGLIGSIMGTRLVGVLFLLFCFRGGAKRLWSRTESLAWSTVIPAGQSPSSGIRAKEGTRSQRTHQLLGQLSKHITITSLKRFPRVVKDSAHSPRQPEETSSSQPSPRTLLTSWRGPFHLRAPAPGEAGGRARRRATCSPGLALLPPGAHPGRSHRSPPTRGSTCSASDSSSARHRYSSGGGPTFREGSGGGSFNPDPR